MSRNVPTISKNSDGIASGSVIVFLKQPLPGVVKTRLAAVIGDEEAARLYAEWTTSILAGMQPLRANASVIGCYAGDLTAVQQRWGGLVDDWWEQPDGDLGARLNHGFHKALPNGPAVAIGTDCLDVDAAVVRRAFDALRRADAVLGPASDGGYYLIGLKREADGLFAGVEWSSPRTFIQQRDALHRAGMATAELPMLHDIDTIDDWLAFQRRRRP